jgi:putative tryptophan/tyrosine transport system substrate-binding protein
MIAKIKRREFITLLGSVAAGWPLAAGAQQAKRVSKIGILSPGSPTPSSGVPFALLQFLREFGYVQGQNLAVEFRWDEGHNDRLPELAGDLVRAQVDVIFAQMYQAILAAKTATKATPIVGFTHVDLVGTGLVSSLAHPGGNVTGVTLMAPDLAGKRLELLREVVPDASRVAVLTNTANPGFEPTVRQTEAAAHSLGLTLQFVDAHAPGERRRASRSARSVVSVAESAPSQACRKEPHPGHVRLERVCRGRRLDVLRTSLVRRDSSNCDPRSEDP